MTKTTKKLESRKKTKTPKKGSSSFSRKRKGTSKKTPAQKRKRTHQKSPVRKSPRKKQDKVPGGERNIVIASYNMSFAGDAEWDPRDPKNPSSEKAFHLSNPALHNTQMDKSPETIEIIRQFWNNAINHLKNFITQNIDRVAFIGLQEMDKPKIAYKYYEKNGKRHRYLVGSHRIDEEIREINKNHTKFFKVFTDDVQSPNGRPALTIIWDALLLGDKIKSQMYELGLPIQLEDDGKPKKGADYSWQSSEEAEKMNNAPGRPLMILYTEKGYLLINVHAPNHEKLTRKLLSDFRGNLNNYVKDFCENNKIKIDIGKVFIVGDFNDRYDSLREIHLPSELSKNKDTDITLKYHGTAPLSCCHNWDSSCSSARFEPLTDLPERNGRNDIGTCKTKNEKGESYKLAGPGERHAMGDEGDLKNYRYYGDKVFGADPSSLKIQIFNPDPNRTKSTESDHELVFGEYKI